MHVSQQQPRQLDQPTIGSLFAGIGGFDIGFESAGFKTAWQVEISPLCRAVLNHRFPHAQQFDDVRTCGANNLSYVDVLTGGFPCQDVSVMGKQLGLAGSRTGLFFEVIRIINELRPEWVVLENVTGLLFSNHGEDFAAVVQSLAQCGYVGCWRVLDAQYFGVPTRRRRVFLVAGRDRHPPHGLLADAAPVGTFSGTARAPGYPCEIDAFANPTLLAGKSASQIDISGSGLAACGNGWDSMVDRQRASDDYGLYAGLDEASRAEAHAAGNAVCPAVTAWIARYLMRELRPSSFQPDSFIQS